MQKTDSSGKVHEVMIAVGGSPIPYCPSEFTWGLQDNSAPDSGRVLDGNDTMYKNRTSQKRKIQLSWNALKPEAVSQLLQIFNPEYLSVTYPDAMTGTDRTCEMYVGDRTAPIQQWFVGGRLYTKLSFDLIER